MIQNRQITILYGSQTGTAQDLAEEIWRESKKYYFNGPVKSMDDYGIADLINERIVIFICSTTGQGDEPDNMKTFWKFLLRKNLPTDSLNSMWYAVLGLGDSNYLKFNFVAKKLNKRLAQLGANCMLPIGLCDDQHDLGSAAVSMPWIASLWTKLLELSPLPDGLSPLTVSPRLFRWNIYTPGINNTENYIKPDLDRDLFKGSENIHFEHPFTAIVKGNVRTTAPDHFQDVRLLTFTQPPVEHGLGDVLMIRPKNNPCYVSELFNLFEEHHIPLLPETLVYVSEIDDEMPVPPYLRVPLTMWQLAEQIWDLNAKPRPRALSLLASECTDELEKEKLLEFATPEGQEDLYNYINRPRRTILEVLQDFPHATSKLDLRILFEIFETIKPRAFSIASSPGDDLQILVAVVEYKTILQTPRIGLCSNWLADLKVGEKVRTWVRRGTFKFPKDIQTPLIFVGPGTGLAPFRSVLLWREKQPFNGGPLLLFFGCRGCCKDYHCRTDLERMEKSGMLKLFCAFSRDQDDKIYVQHRISQQNYYIKDLLDSGAFIYVAGSSKNMPQAVKEAFTEAADYIEDLIKNGRYQEETWS